MPPDKRQRLFFALWPDEALRQQLIKRLSEQMFRSSGGRPVPPENFHITLRYLGSLSSEERQCAEHVADTVRAVSFQLVLDRTGYWRGPKVAWLGAGAPPPALLDLVKQLEAGLVSCGLEPELRSYQPHLTFLRKGRPKMLPAEIPPVIWPVNRFVLVHSVTLPEGVHYEVVRSWNLSE
ncbi:MAG TPA: RNA 2',3'-cyclic phosphodiesterase [Gammaproteobacteria bacterium]|nr:RNA 2',3'-cyclic phosphodiesterase [Gammaproteobacteria bacterium]